jgi:MoaA/NifB/PqqE/SkfB family radical SAM enzyme
VSAPEFGYPSRCQHCPAPIWPTQAPRPDKPDEVLWEDAAGITQCGKATGTVPVSLGERLFHQPLPEIADKP